MESHPSDFAPLQKRLFLATNIATLRYKSRTRLQDEISNAKSARPNCVIFSGRILPSRNELRVSLGQIVDCRMQFTPLSLRTASLIGFTIEISGIQSSSRRGYDQWN